jgi:hypothetical protein
MKHEPGIGAGLPPRVAPPARAARTAPPRVVLLGDAADVE